MRTRDDPINRSLKRDCVDGEDTQGKNRQFGFHRRMALLLIAFIAGITFGIIISERLYVEAHRHVGQRKSHSTYLQVGTR
jgi:hypothetical protein